MYKISWLLKNVINICIGGFEPADDCPKRSEAEDGVHQPVAIGAHKKECCRHPEGVAHLYNPNLYKCCNGKIKQRKEPASGGRVMSAQQGRKC